MELRGPAVHHHYQEAHSQIVRGLQLRMVMVCLLQSVIAELIA